MSDNGQAKTEADLALELLGAASAEKQGTDPAALARLSVQGRTEPGEQLSPFVWYTRTVPDEVPAYWSPARDDFLRKFWKQEPILSGAIYSFESRIRTLGWTLDGPQRQVSRYQAVLSEAEFGEGWPVMVGKVVEDLLGQDKGAFVELMRPGASADGPVVGLAHLDAGRCALTGDLEYPVVYYNYRTGKPHKMAAHQVLHMAAMPSPNEDLKGVGYCAVSRVVRAAQIMRDIWTYKREKLSSRPTRGLVLVQGMTQKRVEEGFKQAQEQMDDEGLTRFARHIVLATQDAGQALNVQQIDFASLPDGYDEQTSTTLYAYVVALVLGVDAREVWPATNSGATRADAEVQAMKARGKGFGDVLSLIERQLNWAVLPRSLTFHFDFVDDEEDRAKADLQGVRIQNVVSMYVPGPQVEPIISRLEARQLLADQQILPPEFLEGEPDVTPNITADDIEQPEAEAPAEGMAPPAEPAAVPATEAAPVEGKELARLFGPRVRYDSKSGKTTLLETPRPLALGRKATSKPGASPTRDVPLPADTEERTAKLERSMERAAREALAAVQKRIVAELRKLPEAQKAGDGDSSEPVPLADDDDLWQEVADLFQQFLQPELTAAAQAGAQAASEAVLDAVAVGVDMALVNEAVVKWVREWGFDLSRGLTDTTRNALREAILTWMQTGLGKRGFPDLLAALEPVFGKWRAEMIAVTEVTRAFAEGNYLIYRSVPGAVGEKWKTANDEKVCLACGELHGKWVGFDEDFNRLLSEKVAKAYPKKFKRPPAHTLCRCRQVMVMGPPPE